MKKITPTISTKQQKQTEKNQKLEQKPENIEPISGKTGENWSSKAYKRQHYQLNKEKYKQKAKEWALKNPEKRKEISARDNKKRALSKRLWREKKTFDGNATLTGKVCYLCGSDYRLAIHHKDGNNGKLGKKMNNDIDNLVVLCIRCHSAVHGWWGLKVL